MKVAEWLRLHPGDTATLGPDWPLERILDRLLATPGLRDLYVADTKGRLLGHISHRRLAQIVLIEHRPVHTRRQILERVARGSARELMETHFASARPEDELDDVLDHLLEHGVENMPVVDAAGRSLGVINLTDVLAALHPGPKPTAD